jgi:hypothetical protein
LFPDSIHDLGVLIGASASIHGETGQLSLDFLGASRASKDVSKEIIEFGGKRLAAQGKGSTETQSTLLAAEAAPQTAKANGKGLAFASLFRGE